MSRLAYTVTPTSINLLLDGRMRTINSSHVNFSKVSYWIKRYSVKDYAKSDEAVLFDDLRELLDIASFVAKVTEGRVKVSDSKVLFDGVETKGVITDRILLALKEGYDVRPIARFLDKLMSNPTFTARDEMYLFLESGNLPICDDGDFLAFKKVRPDFKSFHDGKTDNSVGSKPSMPRDEVCSNRDDTCARGLHFCSFDYLSGYNGTEGHVVICKINPADVVAIPSDYNNTKGRAWTYEIVGEVPHEECAHVWNGRSIVSEFGTYQSEPSTKDDASDWEWDNGDDYADYAADFPIEMPNPDHTDFNAPAPEEIDHDGMDPEETHVRHADPAPDSIPEGPKLKRGDKAFDHGGRTFLRSELRKLIKEHGQRGTARLTGIPRTTLQDWLR